MKALTSSCSKAILERLGSPSHRGAVNAPDRLEFCFSLRSRNDKKGCNFWFLKLVQNKGVYPVQALPSKSQVDLETQEPNLEAAEPALETIDPQGQQSEQTNESKFVRVTFQLQKGCNFGEQFLIVGDDPMLGLWDPSEALLMTWSDGHIWTVELDLPAPKSIQFKFILKGKDGDIIWQSGSDRVIHTWETMNRITVCEDWENAELQKIIEEDQLAQTNEEPKVDSEMPTFTENLDNPKEELVSNVSKISSIEDSGTHAKEKPLDEPDLQQITGDISSLMEKPMAIVAENIGLSGGLIKGTSGEKNKRDIIHQTAESTDSPRNDDIIHELEHNGNAAPFKNQERTVESNLFDFESGPVLVPGLSQPAVPAEETGPGEVLDSTTTDTSSEAFETGPGEVLDSTTTDTSSEAFETKDQNIPEFSKEQEPHTFSKEQESDDGTPQEINATINNEPELLDNEYEEQSHIAPAMEDRSNSQPVDEPLEKTSLRLSMSSVIVLDPFA